MNVNLPVGPGRTIGQDEGAKEAHLRELRASVLTDMFVGLGEIAGALNEKGLGVQTIETIALVSIDRSKEQASKHMALPVRIQLTGDEDAWNERQWEAVGDAEHDFATVVSYIVNMRDGVTDEQEESEPE